MSFTSQFTRFFKQAITYVVLVSLQLGTLTQSTQAYAQLAPTNQTVSDQASRIAQERYRIAYATRLETNKPLQYSVSAAQNKANELKLTDTNPNKLFGDGYDLFKYDPLTNPNGAAENALLTRLQSGQLTPGTPEYEQASQIAQQRYRNAYSNALAYNIAPKFTVAEAQRKANEIDLSQVNPNELFGQGFDLFQYNKNLRVNGDAENVLLARLQSGELTPGSADYLQATQIAQERLRVAYSQSLVPPEPKKVSKWKLIAGIVVGAVLTFVTAGALAPFVLSALTGATVAGATALIAGGFVAGTAIGAVTTAVAGIVAGAIGAIASTTITTGSLSEGLKAGGKALVSGSVKAIVGAAIGFSFASLDLLGTAGTITETVSNVAINTLSGAVSSTILGGGSFADNLKTSAISSVVDAVGKSAANAIGDAFPNSGGTNVANYAAHAVLGCATAAAKGGDCAAGALGAAAGEVAAASGFLDAAANSTIGRTLNKDEVVFFGGLVGGTTAAIASKAEDVNANFAMGTATASNAVANNYLNHTEAQTRAKLEAQKRANQCDASCKTELANLNDKDAERDQKLAACDGKTSESCTKTREEVRKFAADYIRNSPKELTDSYNAKKTQVLGQARDTMQGNDASAVGQGAKTTVEQAFTSATNAASLMFKGLFTNDDAAYQAFINGVKATGDGIIDIATDPKRWPELLGAMNAADREKLASAYERGDGNAIGQLMGQQTVKVGVAVGTLVVGGLSTKLGGATIIEGAIPNAANAVIDTSKLTSYALNPVHPVGGNKAIVFDSALGYNSANADLLIAQIQQGVRSNPAILGKADQFGQRFTVDMPITGPNGNTATVRTGWIIDAGATTPRLTTTYVK